VQTVLAMGDSVGKNWWVVERC